MKLQDKDYENENGKRIERNEIDVVGTFEHKSDGFFDWDCGVCGHEHSSRAYEIIGIVFTCTKCNKKNLLLRSDVQYMKRDSDNDKRARQALKYLGQAVAALGE